jgi:hypothetical protein
MGHNDFLLHIVRVDICSSCGLLVECRWGEIVLLKTVMVRGGLLLRSEIRLMLVLHRLRIIALVILHAYLGKLLVIEESGGGIHLGGVSSQMRVQIDLIVAN